MAGVLFVLGILPAFFDPTTDDTTLIALITIYPVSIVLGVSLSRWILNLYTTVPFSWREMFALEYLYTALPSLIFVVLDLLSLLGEGAQFATGVMGLVLVIYTLLTYQKGVVHAAGVTPNQAALVILGPFIIFALVWLAAMVFLMIAGAVVG